MVASKSVNLPSRISFIQSAAKTLEAFPFKIKDPHPSEKLKIEIRLHIASGSHLKSIEAHLQKDLREALHVSLGIDQHVGSIDIIATGIKVV